MASGAVYLSGDWRKDTANAKSFQARMNDRIVTVNTAGIATGMMIFRRVCMRVAPSTMAASSRATGIWEKKLVRNQVAIGRGNEIRRRRGPGNCRGSRSAGRRGNSGPDHRHDREEPGDQDEAENDRPSPDPGPGERVAGQGGERTVTIVVASETISELIRARRKLTPLLLVEVKSSA